MRVFKKRVILALAVALSLASGASAVAQGKVLLHQLGLAGVEIGSNIHGVSIGDARFLPFFEAAERWGAAIFVHALRPTGMERLVGSPILEQASAFPGEVGVAAASMLAGGTLAQLLPRLQHAWECFPALQVAMPTAPQRAGWVWRARHEG